MELSKEEIHKRLIRLRNLEHLYAIARERIAFLETENKQLKARVKELEDKNTDLNGKIEALSFQFEQIKNKLFGKKPIVERVARKIEKKERDIFSYQRLIPAKITETKSHPVARCAYCQAEFKKKWIKVYFEEDIPLPVQKMVTRHEVEVGYCTMCKRQSSGIDIPSKKVVLGDNVRKYICVCSISNRLSHSQIQGHVKDVFGLDVSTGEIGNMQREEALNLRPEYEHLKQSATSQQGTHYDETGWDVAKEEQGKFAWVATGTENNDTIFSLGRSRGGGNIDEIGKAKLGITDDYVAYKNAFTEHQLCWAHPQRKLRDLAESKQFEKEKPEQCQTTYQQFSHLYQKIRKTIGTEISKKIKERFISAFEKTTRPHALDPTLLAKLKISLQKKYQTLLYFSQPSRHSPRQQQSRKSFEALSH